MGYNGIMSHNPNTPSGIDPEQFKPDLAQVAKEKRNNALAMGALGTFVVGTIAGLLSKGKFNHTQSTAIAVGLGTGVVAGAVTGAIGHHAKTSEEERSEVLMKAAESGNFAQSIKKEMEAREDEAAMGGIIIGSRGR